MLSEDGAITTGDYYEKLDKLVGSKLYKLLNLMPKPAIHHIHLTAACPIKFLVEKLCKYDHVFYNDTAKIFKVSKNGCDLEGYEKVNKLREECKEGGAAFDKHLHDTILLKDGLETKENHTIWKYFQPKFDLTFALYNYAGFFEEILEHVCRISIGQNTMFIEWKQIFGSLFDDEGKSVDLEHEMAIFERVQKKLREEFPLFQMKCVACGLKILGLWHSQAQIDVFFDAIKYSNMVVGFDLVNEEDYCPAMEAFMDVVYTAREKAASLDPPREFPIYMHCGESNARSNQQLYDAILMGTKRIGHGFHLAWAPELQKIVKEQ